MLFIFLFPFTGQMDQSSTHFKSLRQREGTYQLQEGTQGCPQEILWEVGCDGVLLFNLDKRSSIPFRNDFCRLNQKASSQRQSSYTGLQILRTQTRHEGNLITRKQQTSFRSAKQNFKIESNDVLILDADTQFLWERDQFGTGTSCLYRK